MTTILDILSPEFLNALPDEPKVAFTTIAKRATDWLSEQLAEVNDNEGSSWRWYNGQQHTAMNVIVASAKRLSIEPIASMTIPYRKDFSSEDFEEFRAELDHYLTQVLLDSTLLAKRDSVALAPKVKDRLRSHIAGMRSQIDGADIKDARRERLHKKLSEFEAMLDSDRFSIFAASRVFLEVLSLTVNILALSDSPTMAKLTSNIMQTFAEAKAEQDERKTPLPYDAPILALPARTSEERRIGRREVFTADLDDEVPF